ncbi:MAG: hypothetical protein FWD12_11820 [Alphaproteobacteria bacterium]|nr:hypothetical protein [Alphaproteobacteria bacterium]
MPSVTLRVLTDEERQARHDVLSERLDELIKEIAREANALVLDRVEKRLDQVQARAERLDELIKKVVAIGRMLELSA